MTFSTSPADGQLFKQYIYETAKTAWIKLDPDKYFNIDFIYTQLPGKSSLTGAEWYGWWTNVSSTYAGDFIRIEGGDASTFENGQQSGDNKSYSYSLSNMSFLQGIVNNKTEYGFTEVALNRSSYGNSTNSSGDIEARPVNQTVRIRKRTV